MFKNVKVLKKICSSGIKQGLHFTLSVSYSVLIVLQPGASHPLCISTDLLMVSQGMNDTVLNNSRAPFTKMN